MPRLRYPSLDSGTSASTPLWAGLIAVLNAALGTNLGFVNPMFDPSMGSSAFRKPSLARPTDNSNADIRGYPASSTGWDACTGLGTPNGVALLQALQQGASSPVVRLARKR
jgi:kumamolisin